MENRTKIRFTHIKASIVKRPAIFFAVALSWAGFGTALGQNAENDVNIRIKEVALLQVVPAAEDMGGIELASASSNLRSLGIFLFGSENRLQYTVIRKASGARKKIVAFLKQTPPPGVAVMAETGDPSATGGGDQGRGTGVVELTTAGATLVSDIGSCYTGASRDSGPMVRLRMVRRNGKSTGTGADLSRIQVEYAMIDQ
jgi:hypothetical protein